MTNTSKKKRKGQSPGSAKNDDDDPPPSVTYYHDSFHKLLKLLDGCITRIMLGNVTDTLPMGIAEWQQ